MVREMRHQFVANISSSVQLFAVIGFSFSVLGIAIKPELRVVFEFCLVGICAISAIVLLVQEKRYEAGTAVWFGSVALMLVACDIGDVFSKILCIIFALGLLWLMAYVTPQDTQKDESSG